MDMVFSFLGIVGVRVLRRVQIEHQESERRRTTGSPEMRTILIGAGQAGLLVAKEIEKRPDMCILPVGFIDDAPEKVGESVHGLRVMGTPADLAAVCRKRHVQQALITIATLPGREVRRLKDLCDAAGVPARSFPACSKSSAGR